MDTAGSRLPLIDPAASKPIADIFKILPDIKLFRVMANAEPPFTAYMKFLDLLFRPLELDAALERMLVLHIARRSACDYAWRANTLVAKAVGVTENQLQAIARGEVTAPRFTQSQTVAFRFVEEAMDLIEVSDAAFDRAKQFYSDRALTEMLYVVGAYMFIARVARTARIPFDEVDPTTAQSSASELIATHRGTPPSS
jgi:alkylhydroperoxidase family enzyme